MSHRYPILPSFAIQLISGTFVISLTLLLFGFSSPIWSAELETSTRKIILLADIEGDDDTTSLATLQHLIEVSPLGSRIQVELYDGGWPHDATTLEDADTIVLYSTRSGEDGGNHPWLIRDRWEIVRRQMDRGCGLLLLHASTIVPESHREDLLDWIGGYALPDPTEAIPTKQRDPVELTPNVLLPADSAHPITLGWGRYSLTDPFATSARFRNDDLRLVPILRVQSSAESSETGIGAESDPEIDKVVGWGVERADGGRGFGFTGGRLLENLSQFEYRSMLLNAIVWSAGLPVPPSGLGAPGERPIRAIVVTGHQYPGHAWRETTLALEDVLRADLRMQLESIPDPEFLAMPQLHEYDVVLLNYCNWERPEGLSAAAKENFIRFLQQGGGLVILHFANGAFHFSLPGAEASDWPEWRTSICRRVWDHRPGRSGHDPYGPFRVDVADSRHAIMRDMESFDTIDELYYRQQGDEPVHILATATSRKTGRKEPMAMVHAYGKGRVFQTVLGHSAESLRTLGTTELLRRGTAWTAGRLPKVPETAHAIKIPDLDDDHFEGFQEDHVVDDRLQFMDTGPFFSTTVVTPGGETWKGIVVRVGDERQASVCYDSELMRVSAAWKGFLDFSPARFGLIQAPRPGGDSFLTTPRQPGWAHRDRFDDPRPHAPYGTLPRDWARYRGLFVHGERVVLHYEVDGVSVWESPWWEEVQQHGLLTRTIRVEPTDRTLRMCVAQEAIPVSLTQQHSSWRLERDDDNRLNLILDPHTETRQVTLVISAGEEIPQRRLEELAEQLLPTPDLTSWTRPGPRRWLEILKTEGEVSRDEHAYVLDTLTMPYDNPYQALMFASGHDFFSNGDAAVCTVHGDVWRVSGIDESLTELRWQRFATGLFQPLGLLVIDDRVHVVGRDQITILEDIDGDGEADFYRNFNNDGHVTANGHEYVTCLERDSDGWFYFLKGDSGGATAHDGCLLRVSPDGERLEVFATGIRNGNGLAIGPDDVVTFSPQEGNWTPASAIFEVRQGGFYGMMPSHHRETAPDSLDPPLCWIPRAVDNSSGGQTWADSDRWGPLGNSLLHFSFGRCRMMVVLRETVGGQAQGGVSPLPLQFLSGSMRGRFRDADGQLYVTGLMGWVTSAVREGCFQRVRYTGRPANLPLAVNAHDNGLLLKFTDPLDVESAENVDNFAIQQWNYRWSGEYGSPEFRPSDPRLRGRDPVRIRSATLLDDQQSVFLEIPNLQPVMQMSIQYALTSRDGNLIRSAVHNTIHELASPFPLPANLANNAELDDSSPEGITSSESRQPGVWVDWIQERDGSSVQFGQPARMVAWYVPADTPPIPFLPPGPFSARVTGWLDAPLRGLYRFRLEGRGNVQLTVNGLRILDLSGEDLGRVLSASIPLGPGPNRLELNYQSPEQGDSRLRLYWSGEEFAEESVPPTALTFLPGFSSDGGAPSPDQAPFRRWEVGRELHAQAGCANCHAEPASPMDHDRPVDFDGVRPFQNRGPDLSESGDRYDLRWLRHWLLDPAHLRNDFRMPRMLSDGEPGKQQAADLVAFLETLTSPARDVSDSDNQRSEDSSLVTSEGEALFERRGCISCHHFEPPEWEDPENRVSLHFIEAKQSEAALIRFLQTPHEFRSVGARMPDMRLTELEATALSTFLREKAKGRLTVETYPVGDPERGARLFAELNCAQCHSIRQLGQDSPPPPAASLFRAANRRDHPARGCLSPKAERPEHLPDYQWEPEQRDALLSLLATDGRSVVRETVSQYADEAIRWLRCTACHDRDGTMAAWPEILIEEGALGHFPEPVPALTWSGEKLRGDWVERLLAGTLPYRTRPWLEARMPAFPEYARGLSRGLAAQHGISAEPSESSLDRVTPDRQPEEIELAMRLLSPGGLDCRQCHAPSSEILDHKNQAQGVGLSYMRERLRMSFYQRWMGNPLRIDPGTKMPQFTLDGRTTQARHLAGGDAKRQFRAIWNYLDSDSFHRELKGLDQPVPTRR